jgi:hypothetical protein
LKNKINLVLDKYYSNFLSRKTLLSLNSINIQKKSKAQISNKLNFKNEESIKTKTPNSKKSSKILQSKLSNFSNYIFNYQNIIIDDINIVNNIKKKNIFSNFDENKEKFHKKNKDKINQKEIKSRIINLPDKQNTTLNFENHILIFGFDIFDSELIDKLVFHFADTSILIIGDFNLSEEAVIKKDLSLYPNLHYIIMDFLNPLYLKKLNLDKVSKCFLLLKSLDKRVNADLQSLQLINFFNANYNFEVFIEQNSEEGNLLLGYTPKIDNDSLKDPFYHPLYMSGRILYISELKDVCSESYLNENLTDAWLSLIKCGFPNQNSFMKGKDLNVNVVTVDIPEFYFNQEFVNLAKDLFLSDISCLPLGIYVVSPIEYKMKTKTNRNFYDAKKKNFFSSNFNSYESSNNLKGSTTNGNL